MVKPPSLKEPGPGLAAADGDEERSAGGGDARPASPAVMHPRRGRGWDGESAASPVTSGCPSASDAGTGESGEVVVLEDGPSTPSGSDASPSSGKGRPSSGDTSPTGSENSMGGGLRALALGLGEGRRGSHPAGERGRQAEAQKRDRSLLSHGRSPSLAGRRAPLGCAEPLPTCQHTVAEYTPSARFPQPRAPRSGLKGGETTWLAKCRGPLTVERQVAVEHAPSLVADIGVNLRHGPCPPRGRAGR